MNNKFIQQKSHRYPPFWFVRIIDRIRNTLGWLSMRLYPPGVTLIELSQGFFLSRAIGVAAELDLAGHLSMGDKSVSELSVLTNTNEEALYRLMRFLAGHGVFIEWRGRVFANNRLSGALADGPDSVRSMVMHQVTGINWNLLETLEWSVKTGENAAVKVLGTDIFTWLKNNPERNKVYNDAMGNSSAMVAGALLAVCNFRKSEIIVDVGGGKGVLLANILKEHSHLVGVVFDFGHVVEDAVLTAEAYGVKNRFGAVAGNFYESIPSGGDTYLLKNVIHLMSDDDASRLLSRLKEALPDEGRILILEAIIDNRNFNKSPLKFDIQMMVGCPGAKERTREQFGNLIEGSGLKLRHIIRTVSPICVLEVTL